jgi:tetratricopeptide (TPR) repeat protein
LDNLDKELQTFDDERQMRSLVNAIAFADGFSLLFVRANQIPQQESLVNQIKANLPDKHIEVIRFDKPIESLLDELQKRLDGKKPDAIFCYNLNNSFPTSTDNFKSPFVVTLNHSRNSFKRTIECPLVLFLPEFAMASLYHGAVDFYSIRSGVYLFTPQAVETDRLITQQISQNQWELSGLLVEERLNRIETIKKLLTEYQALPVSQRDIDKEYKLVLKLSTIYHISGNYEEAEKLCRNVIDYALESSDNLLMLAALNIMGLIYLAQNKYDEAEELFITAIEIDKKTIGINHSYYSSHLHNLALAYDAQKKYVEAEKTYKEAIELTRLNDGTNHPNYASNLTNLASTVSSLGKYAEAELLCKDAIKISKLTVGTNHPDYAYGLFNLARSYSDQNIPHKAILLLKESYKILKNTNGVDHPDTKIVERGLELCQQAIAENKPTPYKKRKPRHKAKKS